MALTSTDIATGDLLVERRILTLAQLDEALEKAQLCGVPLGDVLLAKRWVKPRQYFKTLANTFGLPFLDLIADAPDASLFKDADAEELAQRLTMPWRRKNGRLVVVTANPGPEAVTYARARWGKAIDLAVTSKFDILWTLQSLFREEQLNRAVHGLAAMEASHTACCTISRIRAAVALAGVAALVAGYVFAPVETLIVLNVALALFYVGALTFRGVLFWLSRNHKPRSSLSLSIEARLLRQDELPVYTILVPLFRDPNALPPLAHALRQLHYPLAKLDIKIVLEESDTETIDAAKSLGLEGVFEIIRVPASEPQTKAKACNYALQFARGEFVTVYDAGDHPEPDQLRKVVAVFRQSPADTACVQCRYDYFNAEENWMARRFDTGQTPMHAALPRGLEQLGIPIPLCGMSNHFRIDALHRLRGWNPFCVAADSDLGIRMAQEDFRAAAIASSTYKAVDCAAGDCIRWQSRKLQGAMQTLFLHSRKPLRLWRTAGALSCMGVLFQVGGTVIAALANPWLWGVLALWLALGATGQFPAVLGVTVLFNFAVGGFLFAHITRVVPLRQGEHRRAPYGVIAQIHWMMASFAAYRALWKLVWPMVRGRKTHDGETNTPDIETAKMKTSSSGGGA